MLKKQPLNGEMTRVTFYIKPDKAQKLRKIAFEKGMSISYLISRWIDERLKIEEQGATS